MFCMCPHLKLSVVIIHILVTSTRNEWFRTSAPLTWASQSPIVEVQDSEQDLRLSAAPETCFLKVSEHLGQGQQFPRPWEFRVSESQAKRLTEALY